ncbi:MAG: NUDIX domain-containing protein [Acidimicrobiia bacterium]|nr:NUDIX domain-containing protein [Acidimicrobiia bacterium]
MTRRYPRSPVCAVGALVFRANTVLLIQRAKPPAEGKWSIAGGVVRLGETLEAAVIRELREEAGLEVKPLAVAKVVDRINTDAEGKIAYHYVIIDYLCEAGPGQPHAGSDASGAGFFEIEKLGEMELTEGTADVIREVKQRCAAILTRLEKP